MTIKLMTYAAIADLKATGSFSEMSLSTDEDEHSIEMHLPYVRRIFEGCVAYLLLCPRLLTIETH